MLSHLSRAGGMREHAAVIYEGDTCTHRQVRGDVL